MNSNAPNLSSLSRGASAVPETMPRPRSRWKTRVLIPSLLFVAVAGLFGYVARSALWPVVDVWVVPVVVKPGAASAASPEPGPDGAAHGAPVLAQAPGWIEADPYFISVPALTEGVIREVLVLEGQRVEAGQVVARMVDEDARLEVERANAELAERRADVDRARAALDAALARAQEVRDEVVRKRDLVAAGGISEGQFARLEFRLQSMEREAQSAKAAVAAAEAAVRTHLVACEQADLALQRTEIRSPAAGVVMSRSVEPGSRISMGARSGDGASGMAGAVVRLFDPAKLQVRVDVPLADFAKIGVGTPAQVSTETLPDRTFKGVVKRIVQEANIQRNTVQVKVAIEDPDPTLKPEMLTRVRFYPPPHKMAAGAPVSVSAPPTDSSLRLLVPASALSDGHHDKASVWLVDQSSARDGPVAVRREVTLAGSAAGGPDGLTEVLEGLRPADRLVIDAPAGIRAGARLRILGEGNPPARSGGNP